MGDECPRTMAITTRLLARFPHVRVRRERISLREGAFFFVRRTLFPPQDKRNTRDKAKSLCITSERDIGELDMQCLSTINRGQHSRQQSHIGH